MMIDRMHALSAFAGYTVGYNTDDAKVMLKIAHTYRVASLCERIAQSISLPDDDVDLAWLCGLLHDIGRFEQLRRYGTFDDALSINHAACSVEVLFEQGQLAAYFPDADPATAALLQTAIATHNAYRLPEDLDKRTLRFCTILRDADKIDILRVNVETPLEDIYNVTTQALRTSPISDAVMAAFYDHHAVLRSLKNYPADNVVGHASLVYELVYPESLRIVQQQGWLMKLLDFHTDNPETASRFAELRDHLTAWLAEQMQNQGNNKQNRADCCPRN